MQNQHTTCENHAYQFVKCSPEDGNFWRVMFLAIGNKNQCAIDYDEDEMMEYCVEADATGLITADNIAVLIKDAEDKYLPLLDFKTMSTRNGETFAKICDRMSVPMTAARRICSRALALMAGDNEMRMLSIASLCLAMTFG